QAYRLYPGIYTSWNQLIAAINGNVLNSYKILLVLLNASFGVQNVQKSTAFQAFRTVSRYLEPYASVRE
ncbi:MAG: hypothetical protein KZQ81_15910, partial [Candidatus Thiodiazotropha sp. (ex Rostrolucina anterorostrata)]|nr:hypothetical protein [Candidatus Thiodiazotropha sp. (ex Rostrolucina anterorostrata)]